MNWKNIIVALSLVSVVILSGCTSSSDGGTQDTTPSTSTGSKTYIMQMREYDFVVGSDNNPTITANVGDTITIRLKNVGTIMHTFSITEDVEKSIADVEANGHTDGQTPSLFIDEVMVEPGKEKRITFTVDKAGEFSYICLHDKPKIHAKNGMVGKLIVEV